MAEPPASLLSVGKVAASNVLPGWWTMLRGDPNAETAAGEYIPGGIQGAVGGLGEFGVNAVNLFARDLPRYAGLPAAPELPVPEFVKLAQQHHDAAAAQANLDIPTAIEPQNAAERVARDATRGFTELGGGLVGAPSLLRYAPSAIKTAANLLAPAATHPAAMGIPAAAIAGGSSAYNEATKPTVDNPQEYDIAPTADATHVATDSTPQEYDIAPTTAKPMQSPQDVPAGAQEYDIASQGPQPPTLDIPPLGDTSFPIRRMVEFGVGALGALFTHRVSRSIWSGLTETKRNLEYEAQRNAVGLSTADPNAVKPPGYDPTQPVPVPQVQLPGDTGLGTALKTQYVDENARINQTLSAYEATPEDAQAVKRAFGQINDRQTAQARALETFRTGIEPTTKVQLPALENYAQRYAALDPQKQATIDSTLKYRNELNNRDIMFRRALATDPQITADSTDLRYSFWEVPTSDMRQRVAAAMNDPVTAAFVNEYDSAKRAYLQHVTDRGLITQQSADNLMNAHPNHISRVDPTGRIVDLFGQRELSTRGGPNIIEQNAIHTMMEQLPQMLRSAEINDGRRMAIETFLNGQARKPGGAIIVTELPERLPDGSPPKDEQRRIVNVGYGTGQRSFEIHDARIYNLLTKQADFMPNTLQGVAHATQMLQSFTTGTGSLLAGRLFGLSTNLPRNILAGSVNRPKGMAGGITDKLLQTVSGGHLGLRVPDPLSVAGSAYELLAGSGAMFAKGIANILERGSPGARLMRGFMGEQGTRNMIDALNRAYSSSNLSRARAEGSAGSGQGSRSRVAVFNSNTLPAGLSAREAALALTKPYNPSQTAVPELYHGNGMSWAVRSKALLNDLNNLMNDAYHLHVRRLNPQMRALERGYEVNQLVGAPGQLGASKVLRGSSTVIPYLTPSIQGTARAARAYNEAPLGVVFGKLATYAMLMQAEQWLSLQGGPNHINFLQNVMTPMQKLGSALLQLNPNDPSDITKIPTPQEDWFILEGMRILYHHGMQAWEAMHDEPFRVRLANALASPFHSYLTKREAEGLRQSVTQLVDPLIQAPPLVNAFTNALGVRYRGDTGAAINGVLQGRPLFGTGSPLVQGIQDPYRLSGQDLSNEGGDVGIIEAMKASIFGATHATWSAIADEAHHAQTLGEFVGGMKDVLQARFRTLNPIGGGVLYPSAPVISPRGAPEQQYVANTMHNLKDVGSLVAGQQSIGLTRKGGVPIEVRGQPQVSSDPLMQQLLSQASALHNHLANTVQPHINDLDKLRQNIQATHQPQDVKRNLMNDYSLQIQAAYVQAQQIIDKANEQASNMIGAHVDFAMPIDYSKPSLQFTAGRSGPELDLAPP